MVNILDSLQKFLEEREEGANSNPARQVQKKLFETLITYYNKGGDNEYDTETIQTILQKYQETHGKQYQYDPLTIFAILSSGINEKPRILRQGYTYSLKTYTQHEIHEKYIDYMKAIVEKILTDQHHEHHWKTLCYLSQYHGWGYILNNIKITNKGCVRIGDLRLEKDDNHRGLKGNETINFKKIKFCEIQGKFYLTGFPVDEIEIGYVGGDIKICNNPFLKSTEITSCSGNSISYKHNGSSCQASNHEDHTFTIQNTSPSSKVHITQEQKTNVTIDCEISTIYISGNYSTLKIQSISSSCTFEKANIVINTQILFSGGQECELHIHESTMGKNTNIYTLNNGKYLNFISQKSMLGTIEFNIYVSYFKMHECSCNTIDIQDGLGRGEITSCSQKFTLNIKNLHGGLSIKNTPHIYTDIKEIHPSAYFYFGKNTSPREQNKYMSHQTPKNTFYIPGNSKTDGQSKYSTDVLYGKALIQGEFPSGMSSIHGTLDLLKTDGTTQVEVLKSIVSGNLKIAGEISLGLKNISHKLIPEIIELVNKIKTCTFNLIFPEGYTGNEIEFQADISIGTLIIPSSTKVQSITISGDVKEARISGECQYLCIQGCIDTLGINISGPLKNITISGYIEHGFALKNITCETITICDFRTPGDIYTKNIYTKTLKIEKVGAEKGIFFENIYSKEIEAKSIDGKLTVKHTLSQKYTFQNVKNIQCYQLKGYKGKTPIYVFDTISNLEIKNSHLGKMTLCGSGNTIDIYKSEICEMEQCRYHFYSQFILSHIYFGKKQVKIPFSFDYKIYNTNAYAIVFPQGRITTFDIQNCPNLASIVALGSLREITLFNLPNLMECTIKETSIFLGGNYRNIPGEIQKTLESIAKKRPKLSHGL